MYVILGLLIVGGIWFLYKKTKKNDRKGTSDNTEKATVLTERKVKDDGVIYISLDKDFDSNVKYSASWKLVERIEVPETHPNLSVVDGILYNKEKTILLCCPPNHNANVHIPSSVERISALAFRDCVHIQKLVLPSGIKAIGAEAFLGCRSLITLDIPDGVKEISYGLFRSCDSLSSVRIPDSVTVIERRAFSDCKSLEKVSIPKNVVAIEKAAFHGCEKLKEMEFLGELKEIGEGTFSGCKSLQLIDLPNGIEVIGIETFSECISLQSIQIPNTVKTIGTRAFYNCKSLRSIEIPDSVSSFGSEVLDGCNSLLHITAGVGIDFVRPAECFRLSQIFDKTWNGVGEYRELGEEIDEDEDEYEYEKIKMHVYTPKKGKSILSCDKEGFIIATPKAKTKILVDYMGNQTELEIPEGITEIGRYAFYQRGIKSIVVPNSVKKVDKKAFYQCKALEKVVIQEGGRLFINDEAFAECSKLQDVLLGEGVQDIGSEAFRDCKELKKLNIPKSVRYIYDRIVFGCDAIEEIVFEDTIGWALFLSDKDSVNVEYPQINAKKLQTSELILKD